jgi:hypothetical protein
MKLARGTAGEAYYAAIYATGREGITATDLCERFGIVKPWNATVALRRAGKEFVNTRPTSGRPSRFYAKEFAPVLVKYTRATKSKCPHKVQELAALVRMAGKAGLSLEVVQAHFGVSVISASERVQAAVMQGLIVGITGLFGGKSHRKKLWFAPEHVPASVLPVAKKKPERKTWDKDQEVIYPAGLKFTLCPPCQLDRYRVDPSIAGRGVISQDYFARRQA